MTAGERSRHEDGVLKWKVSAGGFADGGQQPDGDR
ncbi:uncharacterized protein FPRN_09493 [Fusarium proliferatum]|nr:uncharacterized protein FPRN_09493 [Fusarium proliferatum]